MPRWTDGLTDGKWTRNGLPEYNGGYTCEVKATSMNNISTLLIVKNNMCTTFFPKT